MPSAARRLAWRYRRVRRDLPNVVRRAVLAAREPDANGAAPAAAAPEPVDGGPDREALVRALTRGHSVEQAVVNQVRALLAAEEYDTVQSLAESLRRRPETEALGNVAGGMAAFRRGYPELAWEHLRGVPRDAWAAHAAGEYVRSGLAVAPEETLAEVRRLVDEDPPELRARRWFEILGPVYGFGAEELARDVFAIFDRQVREERGGWPQAEMHRDWLRPWVAASADSATAPRPAGGDRPVFAVMDYGHPSARKASANIGDHIQTIAALGHLVRHQNVRLHGREDLVDLLRQLQGRTRPELQRTDVDADLEVRTVHRDASMYEAIPEGTWVLCFGWFMHALFKMRHGFPLHQNLRPIFVSFHCNKRELLTPEAVEYLKRYGPVGCRDWTTVYLLLSLGVPAFFSGCLTTTINTVFPDLADPPGSDAPVAYVDALGEVPAGAVTYRHSDGEVRRRSFVANVYEGLELLETYRRKHRGIVTSRLHCYLPTRSLGMNVDFRPKNRADVRFDGLIDISDAAFDAIREGLVDKLGQVFGAILGGRPEDEVYALWRELTTPDVALAEERRLSEIRLAPVAADIDGQVAQAIAATVRREVPEAAGEPVQVAVILSRGGGLSLSALLSSLLEHSPRPLDVSVLALPGTGAMKARIGERFPQIGYRWVPVGGLAADLRTPQGTGPRPRAMVRLLLADLLPDVERAVLLPLPAVATADVAALADLDLEDRLLAAPDRPGAAVSGFGVIHQAAARLSFRTEAASSLRRTAHARHAYDFDAFTTDVLVLDLARMRAEGFSRQALPLVEEFGLGDVEALHYLVGPDRAAVPPEWAVVPTRSPLRGPGLVHWADRVKPWQPELTPERERWRRHAAPYRKAAP